MSIHIHRSLRIVVCSMLALISSSAVALAQTPGASPTSAITPTFEEIACTRELPAGLVEGENATCGTVTAPMYHDRESSETVELSVIRIASTSESPAAEPLVMLTGGPGQPLDTILALFSEEAPMYRPLLSQQDVILFDQRGMGQSLPSLACPYEQEGASATPDAAPDLGVLGSASSDDELERLRKCGAELQRSGIDLSAFNTRHNAADVRSIAEAFGVEQVDIWGVSYGSKLALTVMRDHPDVVNSVILSSVLPLETDFFADQIVTFDASLKKIFADCAADADCAAMNPHFEATLGEVMDALAAEPLMVNYTDPVSGDTAEIPVDDDLFGQILYSTVMIGPTIPVVPPLIATVAAGDTAVLEQVLPAALAPTQTPFGALLTYHCQDEAPFTSPEDIEAAMDDADVMPWLRGDTFLGTGEFWFDTCGAWDLPASPDSENEPISSDIPTLIVSGAYDSVTPPENADQVAATLSNVTEVDYAAGGHDPITYGEDCTFEIVDAFLADPSAEIDTSCAEEPVDFSPEQDPGGSPAASPAATPAA